MIGFGDLPSVPISLIDFHGYNDDVIPYDLDHSEGTQILCIKLCLYKKTSNYSHIVSKII